MNNKLLILITILLLTLTGCAFIYPLRVVEPLKTTVIDANTGEPIEGATVLRIVCDIHDRGCIYGVMEKSMTDKKGLIKLSGDRGWGPWFPAPGGLPVPNHQIAIWKEGYYAFIFSQYDKNIDRFAFMANEYGNKKIMETINEIPKERKYLSEENDPSKVFRGGKIKLYKLEKHNQQIN